MSYSQVFIRECPRCGQKAFRRLDILKDHILWKCKACGKTDGEKLFPITKKVIYLDQLVYSLILKSSQGKKADKWRKLGTNIRQLVDYQVIVCPYSTVHEIETGLYKKYYHEITELYRKFSQGISFRHPFHIEQHQLYRSLKNYLSGSGTKPHYIDRRHALSDDPNRWSSRFSVFLNIKNDLEAIEKRRSLKKETCKNIQKHNEDMAKEEMKTFDEDFNIEKTFPAEVIISNHEKNKDLYIKIQRGEKPGDAILELLNDHVEWMIPQIKRTIGTKKDPFSVMMKFLSSEEFYQTPYVYVWAYLFAALNQKVRHSNRKAKEGDFDDIRAISYYLPYCDLMLIDNEFRGLLNERGAPILRKFNTIVISGKKLDAIFEIFQNWISLSRMEEIKQIYKSLDRSSLF